MKIFTRGENPFKSLNIGKRAQIDNWFKTWAPYNNYEIDDNLNIYVNGFLDLEYYEIISLPDNLHIEGYLDLYETKITSLPNNLYVGKFLNIKNTKITSLSNDLQVKGTIYKDF